METNPKYRVEHVATVPAGWKVRTKMSATHMLRIAFPPGARRRGAGKVIEVFHPVNENPCAMQKTRRQNMLRPGDKIDWIPAVVSRMVEKYEFLRRSGVKHAAAVRETINKSVAGPASIREFRKRLKEKNPFDWREQRQKSGDILDAIRHGSRVTIVDRFGKSRTGRAVMRGPAGWVLNMGGAHGTPAIATPDNVTRVKNGNPWTPDIFAKHQIAIAKQTLRMPDEMVRALGGMTKEEAREILRKHGVKNPDLTTRQRQRETRERAGRIRAARRNPDATDTAAALYESFHGKTPKEILEMQESDAARHTYTALGDLQELVMDAPAGKVKIGFSNADAVKVASAPGGKQLYLLGGNQNIDAQLGSFGSDPAKDFVELGAAVQITYRARKSMDDFTLVDYWHKLGEETGEPPYAFYDRLKRRIFLAGGRYRVEAPGIIN